MKITYKASIYFIVLFSLSALLFLLYSQSSRDSNVLVVGTSADYQPYAFIDTKTNQIVGFDIDVVHEIAHRLNKQIEIKDIPFAMLMFDLFSGDIDMVAAGLTPTPRKARKIDFTQVYLQGDPLIALTKSSSIHITSVQDLVGKKIVVNTGYTADLYLSEQQLPLDIVRLSTPALSFLALKSGSVDIFVAAKSSLIPFLEQKEIEKEFAMFILPDTGDDYAIAINKGNKILLGLVNQAIDSMRQDGTLDMLKKKWRLQ